MWTVILSLSLLVYPSSDAPLTRVLGGGILRTCVLRPPGIYGPEEQRHLPRVAVCHPRTRSLHRSWGSTQCLGDAQCWEMPCPLRPTRNRVLGVCQSGLGRGGETRPQRCRREPMATTQTWAP